MTKETKKKLIIGFVALGILGILLPDIPSKEATKEEVKNPVKKEVVHKVKEEKNTLKGGYAACISQDLFDQFVTVASTNDENGINFLLKNGCVITKKGLKFSLLDRGFTGWAKIRVYAGDKSFVLWTYNENLNL